MSDCPRCATPLQGLQAGAFTLGACRACAGVFAPNAAAAHLAQKLDQQIAEVVTRISIGSTDMSAMPDGSPPLPCPICRAAMSRVMFSETSLDTCSMHGTWFDAWELTRVMNARNAAAQPAIAARGQSQASNASGYNAGAAVMVSDVSEGMGMAAVEVVADVAASGAVELAVEGVFAIIVAIFD